MMRCVFPAFLLLSAPVCSLSAPTHETPYNLLTIPQLAQDDEGFEIADFGADMDSGDEEEGGVGQHRGDRTQPGQEGPRYDPPTAARDGANKAQGAANLGTSEERPTARDLSRESLDGETIFAVGEDGDKWSDDEEEDDEDGRKGLVGKKD